MAFSCFCGYQGGQPCPRHDILNSPGTQQHVLNKDFNVSECVRSGCEPGNWEVLDKDRQCRKCSRCSRIVVTASIPPAEDHVVSYKTEQGLKVTSEELEIMRKYGPYPKIGDIFP